MFIKLLQYAYFSLYPAISFVYLILYNSNIFCTIYCDITDHFFLL